MAESLVEQVTAKMKDAMRARDKPRTSALRMIRAAFIDAAKEGKGEVTDDRARTILKRIRKQRLEAAKSYEDAGRPEQAASERAEVAIADEFLPSLADEATTLGWVREAIAASGATTRREMGKVMGALMRGHKAEVDAGLARRLIDVELG